MSDQLNHKGKDKNAEQKEYAPNTVLHADQSRDRGLENLEKAQAPLKNNTTTGGARSDDEPVIPDTAGKRPMQGAVD